MDNREKLEIIETLYEYNNKLIVALGNVVDRFREQKEGMAFKVLIESMEGLEWSINASILLRDELEQYGTKVDEVHLIEILKELACALENADYILLPDLLEYEILEFMKNCQISLQKLIMSN